MSWLLSLFISSAIGLLTVATIIVLMRRQRSTIVRLIAEMEATNLTTSKRLADVLLQQQNRQTQLEAKANLAHEFIAGTRKDVDYLARQTTVLVNATFERDDDDSSAAAEIPPKWIN